MLIESIFFLNRWFRTIIRQEKNKRRHDTETKVSTLSRYGVFFMFRVNRSCLSTEIFLFPPVVRRWYRFLEKSYDVFSVVLIFWSISVRAVWSLSMKNFDGPYFIIKYWYLIRWRYQIINDIREWVHSLSWSQHFIGLFKEVLNFFMLLFLKDNIVLLSIVKGYLLGVFFRHYVAARLFISLSFLFLTS